jgi:hypothetical protein
MFYFRTHRFPSLLSIWVLLRRMDSVILGINRRPAMALGSLIQRNTKYLRLQQLCEAQISQCSDWVPIPSLDKELRIPWGQLSFHLNARCGSFLRGQQNICHDAQRGNGWWLCGASSKWCFAMVKACEGCGLTLTGSTLGQWSTWEPWATSAEGGKTCSTWLHRSDSAKHCRSRAFQAVTLSRKYVPTDIILHGATSPASLCLRENVHCRVWLRYGGQQMVSICTTSLRASKASLSATLSMRVWKEWPCQAVCRAYCSIRRQF